VKTGWLLTTLTLIAIFVVLDLLLLREHGEPAWTYIPGFYALFGLIGAVVLIVLSRLIGRHWLERNQKYYYRTEDDK
jgi:hypothetical protein